MPSCRISLPSDIAEVLVREGVADVPPVVRGGAAEAIHIVVEAINTGAAVVTVATAMNSCLGVAVLLVDRLTRAAQSQARIDIDMGGRTSSLTVSLAEATAAEEEVAVFVHKCLNP